MATTHIQIRCRKCGHTFNRSVYGYMEDPIGIPLMKCPRCDEVYKDNKHKEWIQMSPIKKYFSISPTGNILSLFLCFIPILIALKLGIIEDTNYPTVQTNLIFWGTLLVSWFVCHYIIVCIRANCWKFYNRLIYSIARTRNEAYAQTLSKFGKIYGESIPKIVIFTKASQATIEYELDKKNNYDFTIPTFSDSIKKY